MPQLSIYSSWRYVIFECSVLSNIRQDHHTLSSMPQMMKQFMWWRTSALWQSSLGMSYYFSRVNLAYHRIVIMIIRTDTHRASLGSVTELNQPVFEWSRCRICFTSLMCCDGSYQKTSYPVSSTFASQQCALTLSQYCCTHFQSSTQDVIITIQVLSILFKYCLKIWLLLQLLLKCWRQK